MKHRLLRLLCYQDKLRLNWEVVLMRDPMANILKPIVKQPVAARHVVLYYMVAVQLIQISFPSQSLVLCPV